MSEGYIKDYRRELDSDIWIMPPLYHRVWQYLKYKVNHTETEIPMMNGTKFKIFPGQHLTSYRGIARGVGWYEGKVWKEPNPKTIKKIIDYLEQNNMIFQNHGRGNREYTLITIAKWSLYQTESFRGNSKVTPEKQSMDINNNDNNDIYRVVEGEGTVPSQDAIPESDSEGPVPTDYRFLEEILNCFIIKSGVLMPDAKDVEFAEMIGKEVPIEIIKFGIEKAFDDYKPKYKSDRIRTLRYCEGPIRKLWEIEKAKEVKHSGSSGSISKQNIIKYRFPERPVREYTDAELEAAGIK